MLTAAQWWNDWTGARRPWLILDDGPTLARRGEFDLTPYATAAPAGASGVGDTDLVLFGDNDEAIAGAARAALSAKYLLVPNTGASTDLIGRTPALKELEAEGRLVGYDSLPPGVTGAAALVHLLGSLGAKTVRTLGVDFGFVPTPENVAAGDQVAAAIQKYQLTCGPLTAEVPARIYIGTDPSQMLGAKVLEYSIRKHTTLSTEFDTMQHVAVPQPKDAKNQARTQFSFSRFAIPALAGYHGRALYLDADMQVFGDLRELWELPFGDSTAMYAPPSSPKRSKQTSVLLMDCDKIRWEIDSIVRDLDEGRYDYEGLMADIKVEPEGAVQARVPTDWNSLEEYKPSETRLIHYTDMNYQPWVSRRNENGDLWTSQLCEAIADGAVTLPEVQQAITDGYVRPSLLWQIRLAPAQWPLFRKLVAPLLDSRYKPHRVLRKRKEQAGI